MGLLEKLRAAKIIIVSTTVFSDNYYTWLGKYAGAFAPPRTIPRTGSAKDTTNPYVLGAFQDWYEDATIHAENHLSGFNPAVFNSSQLEMIGRRQQSLQDSWRDVVADHYDISTRLGLQTKRHYKTGKSATGKGKNKGSPNAYKEYGNEARATSLTENDFKVNKFVYVLEAFSFARVVYDEFSYENFCVAQFFKNIKAHAKWVLSATPPTGNVKAVCDIGQLLQVHVARPVKLRPGLPLITEGPIVLRQNPTERYLSYGKLSTDNSVYERVVQAHKFIRHFASANPFDEEGLGQITVFENAYCSSMTRGELIRYLDIQRDLQDSNLDIPSILQRHSLEQEVAIMPSSEKRLRAGLALAYVASVASTDGGDSDKIVRGRRENLEKAQKELKRISDVAIWLVLRRSEEVVQKRNESATSIVQDLAWHFESILEGNAEDFGGVEVLEAVTDATFDENQLSECSRWLKTFSPKQKNSEDYFRALFTLLSEKIAQPAWVEYFNLPLSHITQFKITEVTAYLRGLNGQSLDFRTVSQARTYLKELVKEKKKASSTSTCPQQTENGHQNVSNPEAYMKPEDESDKEEEEEEVEEGGVEEEEEGGEEGEEEDEEENGEEEQQEGEEEQEDSNANGSGEAEDEDEDEDEDEGSSGEKKDKPKYPRFGARVKTRGSSYSETESELTNIILKLVNAKEEVVARAKQMTTALNIFRQDAIRKCSACDQHCSDMRFLPECGHFICSSHLGLRFCGQIKSEKYPNGSGCSSLIHKRSIPVNQIDGLDMDVYVDPMFVVQGKPVPQASSKSWKVYKTIHNILQSSNEKVLVFYQFDKQQKEICDLLEYHGTAFDARLGTGSEKSYACESPDKDRVRILKINSEEAAGSNYQDASHVIFTSTPVFAKQEDFEKYVKQAKGRAVRHGQGKDVKVYYFITVNTFEVDLLQLRKRSYIRVQKEDIADFIPMDLGQNTDSDGDIDMKDAPETSS
ncbi:hypothetical protein ONZ43_g57 [Nemania bipapillata]|uniref:Uncharacterized protein n=1 Tax=Nemania bipapillata TaxID=110536 RepID=A0ACC2J9V2_9PEZI|nr:hypothetical protein ONZ43_g57 [Nemania bipapillata]